MQLRPTLGNGTGVKKIKDIKRNNPEIKNRAKKKQMPDEIQHLNSK